MKAEILSLETICQYFPESPIISLSGAGGKTTLMFRIGSMLSSHSILTTTTKVGADQVKKADRILSLAGLSPYTLQGVNWVTPTLSSENGKIIGCNLDEFHELAVFCQKWHLPLINEADGAAMRHIKAPAAHEPVIPTETNVCFYLVGLDVLNRPVCESVVHRPEIFAEITGTEYGKLITPQDMIRLIDHPAGGMKNIPDNAMKIACLTHADTPERISAAEYISDKLNHYDFVCLYRQGNG